MLLPAERKLLYWLDRNARATNRELAKRIHKSAQAAAAMIQRLTAEGVLKACVTLVNTPALGFTHYKVFVKLRSASEDTEKSMIKYLVQQPSIRWVGRLGGQYDLSFSVLAQTAQEFSDVYTGFESGFGTYLQQKNVLVLLSAPAFTREYLLDKSEATVLRYGRQASTPKIDETDKKILKVISQQARIHILDLARQARVTVDIAKYHLKRLREQGVISGFTVFLDLAKAGYEYYSVLCTMHNLQENARKQLLEFGRTTPGIHHAGFVIGSHDVHLEVEVTNYVQLTEILKKFKLQFADHLVQYETLRVLEEFKYDFYPF